MIKPPKTPLPNAIIFFALILDALIFWLPIEPVLLAHGILSIGLLVALAYCIKTEQDLRFLMPFTLFIIPLGPPGGAVFAVALLFHFFDRKYSESFSSLLSGLFPEVAEDRSDLIYDRIIYHLDDPRPDRIPIPFSDIMMYGNYNQKRMAIEKMLRYFNPSFAEPLKMGLTDSSAAIKVQTATALSSIDHQMFDRFITLKKIYEEEPDSILFLKDYADYGAKYALSGILESDRLNMLLSESIPAYHRYIKIRPKDLSAKIQLAKLYMLNDQYLLAKDLLKEVLDDQFMFEASELYLKCLYQLNDYDALHEQSRILADQIPPDLHKESHTFLWAGGLHET